MKWLLIVVLLTPEKEIRFEPVAYESEAECMEVAQRLVWAYPVFEWRNHGDKTAVINPVVRSYVTCVPEESAPPEET